MWTIPLAPPLPKTSETVFCFIVTLLFLLCISLYCLYADIAMPQGKHQKIKVLSIFHSALHRYNPGYYILFPYCFSYS